MANPITEKFISFADTAEAASISEKRLRNWLDRDLIVLDAEEERSEGQHRRFSFLDVIRIGLIARLTWYGLTAEEASGIVEEMIQPETRLLAMYKNTPIAALVANLRAHLAAIWYDGDKDKFYWRWLRTGPMAQSKEQSDHPVFIVVNVGELVETIHRGTAWRRSHIQSVEHEGRRLRIRELERENEKLLKRYEELSKRRKK